MCCCGLPAVVCYSMFVVFLLFVVRCVLSLVLCVLLCVGVGVVRVVFSCVWLFDVRGCLLFVVCCDLIVIVRCWLLCVWCVFVVR